MRGTESRGHAIAESLSWRTSSGEEREERQRDHPRARQEGCCCALCSVAVGVLGSCQLPHAVGGLILEQCRQGSLEMRLLAKGLGFELS